jgi:pyrimidine-specific ribonucleoside hydrolase
MIFFTIEAYYMIRIFFVITFLANAFVCIAQQQKSVSIIFDSDMGPDYDDVGAITILHALADSGQVNILATIASTKYPQVAAVFDVLNTYFGRPDIPIGVPKGKALSIGAFQKWPEIIIAKYPHDLKSNDDASDAVTLYRSILSRQSDKSVTIVTVGFFTNLANLLNSKPDQFSKLNGNDLIRQKVKTLVCMGGHFPQGKEFNIHTDAAASRQVVKLWNTPIIFSGVEIGNKIYSGLPLIQNEAIQNSPVKEVYSICIPMAEEDKNGRRSWDQTATLVAIKGAKPYYDLQEGKMIIAEDGSNTWDLTGREHFYLKEKMSVDDVSHYINALMQHQPTKK